MLICYNVIEYVKCRMSGPKKICVLYGSTLRCGSLAPTVRAAWNGEDDG